MINTTCLIDWAEAYLDSCKERFVKKTYKEKQSIFKRFFKEVDPTMDIKDLTPSITLAYFEKQKKDRTGNASNKDRKNLLAGWNWGMLYMNPRLTAPNPFATPKMPETRHPRYVPIEDDFWKVYELVHGQDQILLLTFIHLACRRGEAFRLKWIDLDFNKQLVRLWSRKNQDGSWEYAWLPMTKELHNAFSWWKKQCPIESEFVFICLEKKNFCTDYYGKPFKGRQHFMEKICEKAGVKRFGFHSIRHLSASVLYAAGYTVSTIQKILRHKHPSTTEIYLRSLGIMVFSLFRFPTPRLLSWLQKFSLSSSHISSLGLSISALFCTAFIKLLSKKM